MDVEQKAVHFYTALAERFAGHPAVAAFWQAMAHDEEIHYRTLRDLRATLPPEVLAAAAEPTALAQARQAARFSVEQSLAGIRTLHDAYDQAHWLESSEVNAVFAFITQRFIPTDTRKRFVINELTEHQQRLIRFSAEFGDAAWQRTIPARAV